MVVAVVAVVVAIGGTAIAGSGEKAGVKQVVTKQIKKHVMSASVVGGCTLARATQKGTTSTEISDGACSVGFPRKVRRCAYNGTIGEAASGGESSRGFVAVAPRVGDPKAVFVRTTNIADAIGAIRPFHLIVVC